MALTMTRTRTQTTLTKLAQLVANVHGEIAFLQQLQEQTPGLAPEKVAAVTARLGALEEKRQALYLTLRQFNPELDPSEIGTADDWLRPYGRRGGKQVKGRYLAQLPLATIKWKTPISEG